MCAHMEDAHGSRPLRFPLPHSETARDGCVILPLFPDMTEDEQRQVVDSLADAIAAPAVRAMSPLVGGEVHA